MKGTTKAIAVALTIMLGAACAANAEDDGFLSDYSKLQSVKGDDHEKSWAVPDVTTRAQKYTAVMIDQPEIFLSAESKYRGAKPDDLPMEGPKKFELVINLKTAQQIGLNIPEAMVKRADKIIK